MKLSIQNGVIVEDANGSYTVPDDIPNPVKLERFYINENNEIDLINEYIGLTNEQLEQKIIEKNKTEEFNVKKGAFISVLIKATLNKMIDAEKILIDKPFISNNELDIIKKRYEKKYNIAKSFDPATDNGEFKFQAELLGISQQDFANLVISEYESKYRLSIKIFDAIEAERIKIEQLAVDADGLSIALSKLEEFEKSDARKWVEKCEQ